jgi:hypothetical protein
MNILPAVFKHRIISHISWPGLLPDLSACDFVWWGYFKMKVFQTCSANLHNLKQRISDEINAIPAATLLRVVESFLKRVRQCIRLDGRHVVSVTLKK